MLVAFHKPFGVLSQFTAPRNNPAVPTLASFRLPAVNVGTRQGGRLRARNVVDCGCGRAEILRALRRALSPAFRASLRGMSSPYGDGRAAPRVARLLIKTPLPGLTDKRFADLQGGRHG